MILGLLTHLNLPLANLMENGHGSYFRRTSTDSSRGRMPSKRKWSLFRELKQPNLPRAGLFLTPWDSGLTGAGANNARYRIVLENETSE